MKKMIITALVSLNTMTSTYAQSTQIALPTDSQLIENSKKCIVAMNSNLNNISDRNDFEKLINLYLNCLEQQTLVKTAIKVAEDSSSIITQPDTTSTNQTRLQIYNVQIATLSNSILELKSNIDRFWNSADETNRQARMELRSSQILLTGIVNALAPVAAGVASYKYSKASPIKQQQTYNRYRVAQQADKALPEAQVLFNKAQNIKRISIGGLAALIAFDLYAYFGSIADTETVAVTLNEVQATALLESQTRELHALMHARSQLQIQMSLQ